MITDPNGEWRWDIEIVTYNSSRMRELLALGYEPIQVLTNNVQTMTGATLQSRDVVLTKSVFISHTPTPQGGGDSAFIQKVMSQFQEVAPVSGFVVTTQEPLPELDIKQYLKDISPAPPVDVRGLIDPGPDWFPIESAPTDGTSVEVFAQLVNPEKWHEVLRDLPPIQLITGYYVDAGGWCVDECREVTHWRPLKNIDLQHYVATGLEQNINAKRLESNYEDDIPF